MVERAAGSGSNPDAANSGGKRRENMKERKTTEEMQLVDIDKLIPYINNARTHSKKQIEKLRSSLREFGFVNPVIIDRDYNVIAGHGRIMAAKEEGIEKVPCVFVDYLTEAQKKAYLLFAGFRALQMTVLIILKVLNRYESIWQIARLLWDGNRKISTGSAELRPLIDTLSGSPSGNS